jgi:hypothetical protein
MRIKSLIGPVLYLAVLALSGCGGGDNPAGLGLGSSTQISGLASKGPINKGTVKVFAIRNGAIDTAVPIGQGQTDANGKYTVDCGAFKGPVMVEVTGGTFTDEVSGATVTLKSPLQAVFANASTGKTTVAVTPLTHLACKRAKGHPAITPDIINESNASVATTFNLPDIVSTLPVAGVGDAKQKKYAAACGSFSQLANNRSKSSGQSLDDALQSVMTELENEAEHSGGLSDDSINRIKTAEAEFNSGGKNETGADAPTVTPTNGILKISTAGPANIIGAVDLTVNLPAGATVAADPATGEAAAGTVTITGAAATGNNKLVSAKVTPASNAGPGKVTISMVNATGFGPGECVTVDFAMAAGATFPAKADAFTVTGASAKGLDGKLLSGVTVAPSSLAAL